MSSQPSSSGDSPRAHVGPVRFVVFGEALTDFIQEEPGHWRSVPGGACWNVARAAARLGLRTGFAGAVSRDPLGDELFALTQAAGLDERFTQRVARAPLLAMVVSRDPPRYFFVGDDSADLAFDLEALPAGWLDGAEVVHFGSISLLRPPHAERLIALAERIHAAGKRISYDPNYRSALGEGSRRVLERMAGLADLIKISDEDLEGIFPESSQDEALGYLRSLAPRAQILFTRGADGMRLLSPGGHVERSAFSVRVVDTVGAGDASVGAWVASQLLRPGAAPREHLSFAAAAAALACGRAGAYAPVWDEVVALQAAARDHEE